MKNDFPPPSPEEIFENALRAGPRPVKLPTGFHQRTENAWRLDAATQEVPLGPIAWFQILVRDLAGPALACLAIALVVLAVQSAPQGASSRAVESPAVAARVPAVSIPLSAPAGRAVQPEAIVATLGASVEQPFADEADRMLEDARRALRFAADQLLSPGMSRYAETYGLDRVVGG